MMNTIDDTNSEIHFIDNDEDVVVVVFESDENDDDDLG